MQFTHTKFFYHKKQYFFAVVAIGILFIFFWTTPQIETPGTIKVWDRNHILLYEDTKNSGKNIPVSFAVFPQTLIDATVASEDETFWQNPGVDLLAIVRSSITNIQEKKIVTGASTITQQVTRLSLVQTNKSYPERLVQKIREIMTAARLGATYSKKDILTLYLNHAYYGNLSYGVGAASRSYFNKDVQNLSLAESAFLTGLLSSPQTRDPYTNMAAAKKRQHYVLDAMVKQKSITLAQANQAKKEQIFLHPQTNEIKAPHFVHYVLQQLNNDHIPTTEGINVYTTLDYSLYILSKDIATLWVKKLQKDHELHNASLVLLQNNTGEILDMLGGIDYFDQKNQGQVNMTLSLRQPGSALKPITYATAFIQGATPATSIYDIPTVYKTKKGEGYTPNNYDGRYHGLVLARDALASSLNLPAVEMLHRIGIPAFLKSAKALGITTLNQDDRYDLSLTLGGGEITLLDLTTVYASFARGGMYKPAYAIEKITTDDNKVLYQHIQDKPQLALGEKSQQIAYLISDILSDPQARLLGFYEKNPLVLSRTAAAKTGTTTDWHDNWTLGYTPSYTVGVWVGNNDNHPMKNLTGITGAAPIWQQFFEEFLKGKPTETFQKPEGIETKQICKLSGLLPDDLCENKRFEVFLKGTSPKQKNTLYKKNLIDTRNGLLADTTCPKEYTSEKIFINYPPQLYTWAVTNNQETIPREYSSFCEGSLTNHGQSFITITYPRAKTVFQNAPDLIAHQGIVFEVSVSQDIKQVDWYLSKKRIQTSTTFPFSVSWSPVIGTYSLSATGTTTNGKTITSPTTTFSVVPYKGW